MIEVLAEQIATLCDTLNEYPAVRYRKYENVSRKLFKVTKDCLLGVMI